MPKKAISWMVPIIAVATLAFVTNLAYAQDQHKKSNEKHSKGMMRQGMKGDNHPGGMSRMGMMRGGNHGGDMFFLGHRAELELTDRQAERLRTLKSKVDKDRIRTRADLEIAQVELRDLLHQDKVDVKAVDSQIDKIGKLKTGMSKAHFHARMDAEKILTADQLKKVRMMRGMKPH